MSMPLAAQFQKQRGISGIMRVNVTVIYGRPSKVIGIGNKETNLLTSYPL